jgi:hypothetical protein
MTGRLREHLLRRLRHDARLRALEDATARGILASGDRDSFGDGSPRLRVRRMVAEEDSFRLPFNDTNDDVLHCPIVCGPLLAGRSRREAATILTRLGIPIPSHGSGPSTRSSRTHASLTVAEVWRAVRATAVPRPDELAVMLLLADAIERAGIADETWRRALRSRRWVATVLSRVDGFALRLARMLKEGTFGHAIGIFDGHELHSDLVRLPSRFEPGRSIILFGAKDEDSRGGANGDEKVAFAVRFGVPVLGLAEEPEELPSRLHRIADLRLETGPMSASIVEAVVAEVLGEPPDGAPDLLPDELSRHLSIHDLAAAVRPGLGITEVAAALGRLAGVDEETGQGKDGTSCVDAGATRSAKSRAGASDTSGRNGRTVTPGSELIEPLAPRAGEPAAPTVETLHGYGDAKAWALNLKQDLGLWTSGMLPWSQMSTKLLLSGPPGTGKTTFARALCNTLQIPLVATSVSTWLEPGHLGDVIKRMRLTFEEARRHAPCILFVDEIDGIGRRGEKNDYDDYWNAVVNKLLELIDGTLKSEGLIIVGATNRPGVIDPAIRRSGRLETHIEIPLPDVDALIGILAQHLGPDLADLIATRPAPSEVVGDDTRIRSASAVNPIVHRHETETADADV